MSELRDKAARIVLPSFKAGTSGEHVEVDGQDITRLLRGLTLRSEVGEVNRLELTLLLRNGVSVDGRALVGVSEETADMLKLLGWTPPAEDA